MKSRLAFYAIAPYGASFLISQLVDFDYFDTKFKVTNLFIFISYFLGVFLGAVHLYRKKMNLHNPKLPILDTLIPIVVISYLVITLYFVYQLGSNYGWLNLGAYRAFYYDVKSGLIGNAHSFLYICLLFAMFFYINIGRVRHGVFVCVLLSILGLSEGAKASMLLPWIYLFFSYLYVAKSCIRLKLSRSLFIILFFFALANNFDFDDIGVIKMIYFYLNNGIYNFMNTLNGDYNPISYHITNINNIILERDAPVFNYDKVYLGSFDLSSNTAAAPATYVSYFGYSGLFFIYFMSGFILSHWDQCRSRSTYSTMLVALLSAGLFMSFFEEYILNNIILFFKLCIIYWIFLGFQKLFFPLRKLFNNASSESR
jgi:oligosaccharide repeat unit polymerase